MKLHGVTEQLDASRSDLSDSQFNDVNLSSSQFNDVNLANVQITDANLAHSSFENVNLSGSKIHDVNLSGLEITNCRLTGATIDGVLMDSYVGTTASNELLNQTLETFNDVLKRAQLLLPSTEQDVNWAAHVFTWQVRHGRGVLHGLVNPRLHDLAELSAIERQKKAVVDNTRQFVKGLPANHVLLTGARGTGKSSLVRACLKQFADEGLRVIEVDKADLHDLPQIVDLIRNRPERFVVFCDDLTFGEQDEGYKSLKVVLDGSFSGYAENVLVYATSNRRHLLPEYSSDNVGYRQPSDEELHPSETVEEKISLSERFGLWLSFYPFKQNEYLAIATQSVERLGWVATTDEQREDLRKAALQFTLERGSRSARVAQHFARQWVGAQLLGKTNE